MIVTGGLLTVGAVFYIDAQRPQEATPQGTTPQGTTPQGTMPQGTMPQGTMPKQSRSLPPAATPTSVRPAGPGSTLPSPLQQKASSKPFMEGHWRGMELIALMPELLAEYRLPPSTTGLLVDEVSLEAAESGMLAGDVVKQVGAMVVEDLQQLYSATFAVREQSTVHIGLLRKGQPVWVVLRTQGPLGFAMFEAASPIPPGSVSPHKTRDQPCTDCHVIMATGGQLAVDAGDIPPTPPPITAGTQNPHDNRGPCVTCHLIMQSMATAF